MRVRIRRACHALGALTVIVALLAGWAIQPAPAVTATVGEPHVIANPERRYQLSGDGTTTPYYWVWIPAGPTAYAPWPPPPPGRF